MRFPDKPRHQFFIEPLRLRHRGDVPAGAISSSLPEDVQLALLPHRSPAWSRCRSCATPTPSSTTACDPLAAERHAGIHGGAGPVRRRAVQRQPPATRKPRPRGLMAGINAARKVQGKEPLVLDRASSYIGTLIDDLVTKGVLRPLPHDDLPLGVPAGAAPGQRRRAPDPHRPGAGPDRRRSAGRRFLHKQEQIETERRRIEKLTFGPSPELNRMLEEHGTAPLETGAHAADLIRRPQIGYQDLAPFDPERPELPDEVTEQVEIQIEVRGLYSKTAHAGRTDAQTRKPPSPGRYSIRGRFAGLRLEAIEKLQRVRPHNIGQASRSLGGQPGGYFGAFDLSGEQKTGRITVSCETSCRGGTNSRGKG